MSKEKLESLFQQIKSGEEDKVIEILTSEPYLINEVDVDGCGPIHVCASSGQNKILQILVEKFNANVNQCTEYFNTPIHTAAKYGKIDTMLELKQLGADLTLENRMHETVVDFLQHYHIKIPISQYHQMFDDMPDLIEPENHSIKISGDVIEVC